MTTRKFYKTIFRVEVLSEEPLGEIDLGGISYAITDGNCSGRLLEPKSTQLNGKQAARALIAQASDPGFFNLTQNGCDAE